MSFSLRVLIIDDQLAMRDMFTKFLNGYNRVERVVAIEDLFGAALVIKQNDINVVVLDLNLIHTAGIQTLMAFKVKFPNMPVVVTTGHDRRGLSYECFSAGASEYLVKPDISGPLLYNSCQYAIERHRSNAQICNAETALHESEERFRRLFESAQDGILIIDYNTGKILEVNQYLIDMLGYTRDEFVERYLWEISPFRDTALNKEAFLKLQTDGYIRYEDLPIETSSGHRIDVEFVSNTYMVGDLIRIQCNIRNITERVQLEARERLIINILSMLNEVDIGKNIVKQILILIQEHFRAHSIGIRLRQGEDYPYFVYNGFTEEFIRLESSLCVRDQGGLVQRNSCGEAVLECVCGCVIRGLADTTKPYFTSGGSFWTNSTTTLLADSSIPRPAHTRNECNTAGYESVAIIPLKAGNKIIGTLQLNDQRKNFFKPADIDFMEKVAISIGVAMNRIWVKEELTQVEIARTRDLLESARQLNAGVAHELRTPLQTIMSTFQIIEELESERCTICAKCGLRINPDSVCPLKQIRGERMDMVHAGINAIEYAIQILNSLSAYSKIASSKEVHTIDIYSELHTITQTLKYTDQFKGLDMEAFVLRGASACGIKMNRVDFQQLIINLCKNAMEAIDHDHPQIFITAGGFGDNATIQVEDNGRGIDSGLGNKIFEAYFSTKEGKSDHNQGLGLAMVRDILKAYGGSIAYTSQPGKTVFTVSLPCS